MAGARTMSTGSSAMGDGVGIFEGPLRAGVEVVVMASLGATAMAVNSIGPLPGLVEGSRTSLVVLPASRSETRPEPPAGAGSTRLRSRPGALAVSSLGGAEQPRIQPVVRTAVATREGARTGSSYLSLW